MCFKHSDYSIHVSTYNNNPLLHTKLEKILTMYKLSICSVLEMQPALPTKQDHFLLYSSYLTLNYQTIPVNGTLISKRNRKFIISYSKYSKG